MINAEAYVNLLINTGLTQKQLLFLILLREKRKDLIKKYKERFPTDDKTMIGQDWIKDLFYKGFITKNDEGIIKVTGKFNKYYIRPLYNYRELVDVYPKFFEKDNVKYPLTLGNEHILSKRYDAKIYGSVDEHLKVLELLEYAIKNDLINFGVEKFIDSRFWIALEEHKKAKNEDIKTFINFKDF